MRKALGTLIRMVEVDFDRSLDSCRRRCELSKWSALGAGGYGRQTPRQKRVFGCTPSVHPHGEHGLHPEMRPDALRDA